LVPQLVIEEDELTEIHYRVIKARQYDRAVTVRWWHPIKNGLGEIWELFGLGASDTT